MKGYKLLMILLVIFAGICFYWFQVRPSQIRKNCYKEAVDQRMYDRSKEAVVEILDDIHYRNCLKKSGLK